MKTDLFFGEIALDESCFGGPRKKIHAKDRRKRGRGAENKVPVFGIKKREGGKVIHSRSSKNASKKELLPIIRRLVSKKARQSTRANGKVTMVLYLMATNIKINHPRQYSGRKVSSVVNEYKT